MKFLDSDSEDSSLIDLTPLIDVVFLLLIFFMVTTTFTKESELQVRLPEANSQPIKANAKSQVEVMISKDSELALRKNGSDDVQTLVNSERSTLIRALNEYQGDKNTLLIIRADKDAKHQTVINVMDVARELNLSRVTFATQNN